MLFKAKNIEPGYKVVISQKPVRFTGDAWIVEKVNSINVVCKLLAEDCPGTMNGSGQTLTKGDRLRYANMLASGMHILIVSNFTSSWIESWWDQMLPVSSKIERG